jgi:hypothetical protein
MVGSGRVGDYIVASRFCKALIKGVHKELDNVDLGVRLLIALGVLSSLRPIVRRIRRDNGTERLKRGIEGKGD